MATAPLIKKYTVKRDANTYGLKPLNDGINYFVTPKITLDRLVVKGRANIGDVLTVIRFSPMQNGDYIASIVGNENVGILKSDLVEGEGLSLSQSTLGLPKKQMIIGLLSIVGIVGIVFLVKKNKK